MTGPSERDAPIPRDRDAEATSPDADDALAAYALDAVDDEERAAIERALAASPELRDKVGGYAETATQLADLADPLTPPPGLKSRLMTAIEHTPQVAPDVAGSPVAGAPEPAAAPLTAAASEAADSPTELPASVPPPGPAETVARRRWFQRPGAIIAAAAAAVVLIVGAIIGIGWSGPNGWGAQREMSAIAEAADVQSATHELDGGGEVTLVWSAEQGRSGVVVEGLPDLGAEETYELWYIDDSGAEPAGTFDVAGAETWRVLEGDFRPGVAVGVTVEPAGGSPEPTTEPIVVIPT
jgi:anti-sigma-K factor RskA